jgi:CHASE3 domain sensor protein
MIDPDDDDDEDEDTGTVEQQLLRHAQRQTRSLETIVVLVGSLLLLGLIGVVLSVIAVLGS